MSGPKPARKKQSLWQTLHAASGSYRRLYSYVKPYKGRFILGLALGLAYGGVNSLFPLAISRVTSSIFQGSAPKPMGIGSTFTLWIRAKDQFDCSDLSCHSGHHDVRSLCSYGSTYCMQWVSNKVVSDIRVQLFSKMVRHSMDFFNKMRSGFLMSRITNDTRVMQMALTSVRQRPL
jgi:subfamily B ATP-binding cassette protein MsbA